MNNVFEALKVLLQAHTHSLDITQDEPGLFWVNTFHVMSNGKPLFFGAVQTRKNYVSYHLMPVYVNPALLSTLSPELKKRMQGKSCFNFKAVDTTLFTELDKLTGLGLKDYRAKGYLTRPKNRRYRNDA